MPAAVGAAIAGAATFLASGTPLAFAANTALLVGLSAVSARLARQDLKQGTQPRDIVIRSGSQPKIIVYGEAVVGGALAYMNQVDVGNDDFELWAVVVHAAHEVGALDDVYYETDELRGGTEIDWGTNNVVAGPWFAVNSQGEHAAKIWRYFGTDTQTVNTDLRDTFADITNEFRLRGYCYTVHRWRLWQESEEIFKGGQPQNIRAKIRGKEIYDPRLDTSPGANPDDPTYFAWSRNPILVGVDYMRSYWTGGGIPADRFDWDDIVANADICDFLVDTPSGQQPRYACDGAIDLGAAHDDNLDTILSSCLGQRVSTAGLIQLKAGGIQSASVALDESDIIGRLLLRTSVPRDDRYNKVTGTYISEESEYIETDFIPVDRGGLYLPRDNNEVLDKVIKLDLVVNEYQAQRIAWKHLNASNQQQSVEVPLRWSGMRLTPGTYVDVTYPKFGWSNKLFRCQSLKIGESGIPVTAVLEEDASSAWDDPAVGDYSVRTQEGQITKPDPIVPPPANLVANGYAFGGDYGISLKWTNPSDSKTWDWVDLYASPDSDWANATRVATRLQDETFLHSLPQNTTRFYWLRAVRNGVESIREPDSDTSSVTATAGEELDVSNDVLVGQLLGGSIWGNPGFGFARSGLQSGTYGRPDRWFLASGGGGFDYADSTRDVFVINGAPGFVNLYSEIFPVDAFKNHVIRILARSATANFSPTIAVSWRSDDPPETVQAFTAITDIGQFLFKDTEMEFGAGTQDVLGTIALTSAWTSYVQTWRPPEPARWACLEISVPAAGIAHLDWVFGSVAQPIEQRTVETGNRTIDVQDIGTIVECSGGSAQTITLPNDPAIPDQGTVRIYRTGAGAVSIQTASGVTMRHDDGTFGTPKTITLNGLYSWVDCVKASDTVWDTRGQAS